MHGLRREGRYIRRLFKLYFFTRRGNCFSIKKPLLLLLKLKAIVSPGSVDNNVVINSIQIVIMFQSKTIASSTSRYIKLIEFCLFKKFFSEVLSRIIFQKRI